CLAVALAFYFWTQSRYPQLNQKAVMVHAAKVSDVLSTWPTIEVRPEYHFTRRVAYSTVNWILENRKGMTFGVLMGALFLTLFGYTRGRTRSNSYLNAFYGLVLGAPLAVCVNCAAPIFKGVLRSRRVETAFATMLSSPTMNVVVLSMVF